MNRQESSDVAIKKETIVNTSPALSGATIQPPTVIVIEPRSGWASLRLGEMWEFRDLFYFLVWRDLKARYRQTALGPLWIILQPLFSMVLYTLVFGVIAKLPSDGIPYPVFSYMGLLPWTFFATAVSTGTGSLLSSKDLIAKVYFPRLLLPLATIVSSLVDFAISFVILLGLMAFYGLTPTWGIVFVPFFLLLAGAIGLGTGLWFAGAVVRYRDFGQFAGFVVRAWMYATPVVYSISIVPAALLPLYKLNPMTGVVEGFRWALLGQGTPPDWTILISALITIPIFVGGLYVFRRVERTIVDIV